MSMIKDSDHLRLTLQDIESATNSFKTLIGRGGYGDVYKGNLPLGDRVVDVAVKRLNTKLSNQGRKEFMMEILLLSRYKHPNLISLLGYCDHGPEKILIYEYAPRGSLEQYLRPPSPDTSTFHLTWKQRLNICIDTARGLDYLHNHVAAHERVIHRDIKSANILLDNSWKAMIADLGLSKLGRANESDTGVITDACGTPGYCDPCYINTGVLTKESDVYSFGVVLFEVLCGKLCSHKVDSKQRRLPQLAQNYYKKDKLNRIIDPSLKEYMDSNSMNRFSRVAYQCLLDDRKGRPPMNSVLYELEKALQLLELEDPSNKHVGGQEIQVREVTNLRTSVTGLPVGSFRRELAEALIESTQDEDVQELVGVVKGFWSGFRERPLPDYQTTPQPSYYYNPAPPTSYPRYPPSPYNPSPAPAAPPAPSPPPPPQHPYHYGSYSDPYSGYYQSGYYSQPPPPPPQPQQTPRPYTDRPVSYGAGSGGPSAPVDYAQFDQKQKVGKPGLGVGAVAGGLGGLSIDEGLRYEDEKIGERAESELNARELDDYSGYHRRGDY